MELAWRRSANIARNRSRRGWTPFEGHAWETWPCCARSGVHNGQRSGIQDGVGRLTLADVPRMMHEHDTSHRNEIIEWAR